MAGTYGRVLETTPLLRTGPVFRNLDTGAAFFLNPANNQFADSMFGMRAATLAPIKAGQQTVSDAVTKGTATSAATSGAVGAFGDALGVVGGAFMAINNLHANIEAYNKAKDNYAMAQMNALKIFEEANAVAEDMRAEADTREAANLARSARSGLNAQAYDNLILSDRVQLEKDVLAMKEDAQFEAISMLNTARRIKSRQKRKATVGAIGTAVLAIATAGVGLAAAGGLAAMGTTLSVGNMINSGITGAMSNGR